MAYQQTLERRILPSVSLPCEYANERTNLEEIGYFVDDFYQL